MKHTNINKASFSHSKEETNQVSHSATQKKNSTKLNSIALGIIKTATPSDSEKSGGEA